MLTNIVLKYLYLYKNITKKMKPKKLPFNFIPISTIGDGSCFLHALLQSCNKTYNKLDLNHKKLMVRKLRLLMGNYLENSDIYGRLSRGELEEISNFVMETKKDYMVKYIKSDSWITYHYIEMISNIFNINIFIINNGKNTIYNFGDNELLYNKKRNSIFINYIDQAHFESLAVRTKDGRKTYFSPKSSVIEITMKNLKCV